MLYGNMEARYRGWWLRCRRKAVRQQRYSLEALGRCRGSPPRSTSGTVHGISLSPEVLQLDSGVIIRHDMWVLQVFSHMASNAPTPILVKATLRRQGLATTRSHCHCICYGLLIISHGCMLIDLQTVRRRLAVALLECEGY